MRPRVFPAEDDPEPSQPGSPTSPASMRPRVFPAEDCQHRTQPGARRPASMRPRVFPAEDSNDGKLAP